MDSLIQYKDKIISVFRPSDAARSLALRLMKDNKITESECQILLEGLQKVNLTMTIDNHVEIKDSTHWGNVATGGSSVNDYFDESKRSMRGT